MSSGDHEEFDNLETRLRIMLPEQYQDCYSDIQPVSMGSAGLKFGKDGRVAWDEIWGSFCDLAMAGGPPHRGTLLEPGSEDEIGKNADRYREIVDEICRGIGMVTGLSAESSPARGWIRVDCTSAVMAGWLARAIVMENVSARSEGMVLNLPAGPGYRLEKEIKNVVTVIAKTCHYWLGHTSVLQHRTIANLFATMELHSPLIQPTIFGNDFGADRDHHGLAKRMAESIQQATGLRPSNHKYTGWLGLDCADIRVAIWMMRALVVSNVLSRREGTAVFVPISLDETSGETVVQVVSQLHRIAVAKGVIQTDRT